MLERYFAEVYTKFKLKFYQSVFRNFENREASLSVVETFCVEVIYALGRPTVKEFADFAQISSPNAAYKINSLIKKGYINKIQNEDDKREFYLEVSDKYLQYTGITYEYISVVMKRIKNRFPEEDVAKIEEMLAAISNELMPEIAISPKVLEFTDERPIEETEN